MVRARALADGSLPLPEILTAKLPGRQPPPPSRTYAAAPPRKLTAPETPPSLRRGGGRSSATTASSGAGNPDSACSLRGGPAGRACACAERGEQVSRSRRRPGAGGSSRQAASRQRGRPGLTSDTNRARHRGPRGRRASQSAPHSAGHTHRTHTRQVRPPARQPIGASLRVATPAAPTQVKYATRRAGCWVPIGWDRRPGAGRSRSSCTRGPRPEAGGTGRGGVSR